MLTFWETVSVITWLECEDLRLVWWYMPVVPMYGCGGRRISNSSPFLAAKGVWGQHELCEILSQKNKPSQTPCVSVLFLTSCLGYFSFISASWIACGCLLDCPGVLTIEMEVLLCSAPELVRPSLFQAPVQVKALERNSSNQDIMQEVFDLSQATANPVLCQSLLGS